MQVWCDWQVTLYDPHLSALEVRFSRRCAIQINVYLYLTFTLQGWQKIFNRHEIKLVVCAPDYTVSDGQQQDPLRPNTDVARLQSELDSFRCIRSLFSLPYHATLQTKLSPRVSSDEDWEISAWDLFSRRKLLFSMQFSFLLHGSSRKTKDIYSLA